MIETFDMGAHAAYVWSAYGITLVVLVANAWAARRRKRAAIAQARHVATVERPAKRPTVRQIQ